MAWIRLEQNLKSHPKFLKLRTMMNIDEDAALGRLSLLWLWALDYALDGDLRKFDPAIVQSACKIPIETLVKCAFVDIRPYSRIHDWWDYVGNYLKLRFKDRPEKWRQIQLLYEHRSRHRSNTRSNPPRNPVDVDLNTLTSIREDVDLNESVHGKSTDFASRGSTATSKRHDKNCTCELCFGKVVLSNRPAGQERK